MKFREKLMGPSADRSMLGFHRNPGGPLSWVLELLGGDAMCRPIPTRMALYGGGGRRECPREPATRGDMSQTGSEELPTFKQTHSWRHPQALVSVAREVRAQTRGAGRHRRQQERLQRQWEEGHKAPSRADDRRQV